MKIARIIDAAYNPARWRDPVLKWRLGPGEVAIDTTQPWTHGFAMEAYAGYAGMPDGWTTDVKAYAGAVPWTTIIAETIADGVDMLVTSFANMGNFPTWFWNDLVDAGIPFVCAHGSNTPNRLPSTTQPEYYDRVYWPSMVTMWPRADWTGPTPPVTSFGPAVEFASDSFTGAAFGQSWATATMTANMARALDACGGDPLWARAILRATGGEVKNEQRGFGIVRAFQPLATGVPQPTDPASIFTFVPTPPDPPPGPPPPPPPPQPQPPTPFLSTYPNLVYT
jgi:hypothetical protein